uniref:meiotic recombination protein REC8 homolog isoform X2 n=1 Tax=Monopterus albus TaxID=43700 RepID=UPI0009B41DE6|nr:meiotic recombination protein REC8 homolog isoform X2 [Monopterus albus]
MFYYPTVLRRHTGCFSTICEDIMNYILARVPPPLPDLPRPRFSLYLSSQLQYGIIVVYHRQCAILLEELHTIVAQLLKQRTSQKIDMDDQRKFQVFPDALAVLEETEGASDPLFGVMYMQDALPSPSALIKRHEEYVKKASPVRPGLASPAAAAPESAITASPETITLREPEPATIPTAEFEGVDLVESHPDIYDILLAEEDDFPEKVEIPGEEVTPAEQKREVERERREGDLEMERRKELTGSTLEVQPASLTSEDAISLPQEEPAVSVEKPGSPADQLTPVSVPALPSPPSAAKEHRRPSPELEGVPTPEERERKKRKKRQLIFFDPETQIPQDVLQQQISNPLTSTRRPAFPVLSSHRHQSAADLLDKPCTFLPENIQFLWRQAATITPVSGSDLQIGERGPESTDSEKERECEMVEAAEAAEREQERVGRSLEEVPRDLSEAEISDISGLGALPIEGAEQKEVTREISPVYTPDIEGVSRTVSTLPDIPEAADESVETAVEEIPGLLPELPEHEGESVLFHSLLPPEVDRRAVSIIFQRLLENLSAKKVCAEQVEPYGDILIYPGPSF